MKKEYPIIKIRFNTPLHLSRGQTEDYGHSQELICSDTLKGALCAMGITNLDQQGFDPGGFMDSFRISSAFPFKGDDYYLPKPFVRLPVTIDNEDEASISKMLKKLSFVHIDLFSEILKGNDVKVTKEHFAENKKFLCNRKTGPEYCISTSNVQQRVTIPADRQEDPTPYYIDRVYFERDAGLFFLVETGDSQTLELITKLSVILGENGVGTDRNVGNGFFTVEPGSVMFDLPDQSGHLTNLSLFLPRKEELDEEFLNESAWNLLKRGGYIAGSSRDEFLSLRKKSVYMMEEGSVFPSRENITGKKINLKPEYEGIHDVWRDGMPIFLPINKHEI